MNQNQCVPSCEVGDVPPLPAAAPPPLPPPPPRAVSSRSSYPASLPVGQDISWLDYEVAELTWENGQLTMHGLGLPRMSSKSNVASGTLESIVNQATKKPHPGGACDPTPDSDLPPWFAPASVSMSMDALVPTANTGGACMVGCSTTRVGSCSAAAHVPVGSDWSVSGSDSMRRDTCQQMSRGVNGLTSTSRENTKTVTVDDHDSVCHSRRQKERGKEQEIKKKGTRKSSVSTKRSRAAAIHNQSERKRRDKINQRMKTLQKLVPNSSKTDKASMLDEVIDYLKQLQGQVQMMSRMSLPSMPMMMPMTIQQQLQMSMMSQMGIGMSPGIAGMNMGVGMGIGIDQMNMNINNAMTPPQNVAGISVPTLNPSVFMPLVPWDGTSTIGGDPLLAYLACQQAQQPMTMDAYSKMVAMYQQLQQQQQQQQFGRSSSNT